DFHVTGVQTCALPIFPAIVLMAVFIYTNLPRLEGLPFFSRTDAELPRHMIAQLEYEQGVETGGEGSTFVQEFRPLWASRSLLFKIGRASCRERGSISV